MAAGPIVISILANASQANATLNSTASTAQKVGAGFRRMAAPAGVALAAITAGAKTAIDAASDLSESVSKNRQIFGPQAAEIEKFAGRAAKALGQSKTAALEAASTFGIIGQSAGLSGRETSAFAKQFTTLASDLASFNNTSPEEAVTAISAAMRGESEPIRRYGVMLDDATLRSRALKLGLIDSVKQGLTPQQKALAASQEILAQTGKAQGDFARTADGAANKSRSLAAQNENLQAKLGKQLLPVYVKLQTVLSTVLAWMSKNQSTVKAVVAVVAGLAAAILVVNAVMAASGAIMAIFTATLAVVRGAIMAARIAMLLFNIAMLLNPVAVIVVAIVALIAILVLFFTKTELGRKIISAAWAGIKAAFTAAKSGIEAALQAVMKKISALASFVVAAVKLYVKIWTTAIAIMVSFVRAVVKAVGDVVRAVGSIAGKAREAASNFGSTLVNAGRKLITGLISGINDKIADLKAKLRNLTQLIADTKGPPSKDAVLLRPAGNLIMDGLIRGLEERRSALRSQLESITRTIESGVDPALADAFALGDPSAMPAAKVQANATYNISVRLDSRMTEAEMGVAYNRAIGAAKRQGLIPK